MEACKGAPQTVEQLIPLDQSILAADSTKQVPSSVGFVHPLPCPPGGAQEDGNSSTLPTNNDQPMEVQSQDSTELSTRAHSLQQAQAVNTPDLQSGPGDQMLIRSGSSNKLPGPAGTAPSVGGGVLSQLGQFSSLSKNSDISNSLNLKKNCQQLSDHNILTVPSTSIIPSDSESASNVLEYCSHKFLKTHPTMSGFNQKEAQNLQIEVLRPTNDNVMLSGGGLEANLFSNRPKLQADGSTIKSFAQVAAPLAVSASIPTKGSTPECGLLVERLRGSTLDEYAKAIENVAGKGTLVFIGQSPDKPDYVLAFLEKPVLTDKLVSTGITVRSKWICVTPICQPAAKLIISNVLPFIPDSAIINACKIFGKPVYANLRRIPSSVRSQEFKHLLSYRRELLIVLDEDRPIPEHIKVYSNDKLYTLGINAPGVICFNCRIQGHRAFYCKQPKRDIPYKESFRISSSHGESSEGFQGRNDNVRMEHQFPKNLQEAEKGKGKKNDSDIFSKPIFGTVDLKKVSKFGKERPTTLLPQCSQESGCVDTSVGGHFIQSSQSPETFSNILKNNKNDWQIAGKKGKASPLSKSHIPPPPNPKAKKYEEHSDVASSLMYAPPDKGLQSPDGSVIEERLTDSLPGATNKKRKKVPAKTLDRDTQSQDMIIDQCDGTPFKTATLTNTSQKEGLEPGCVAQLRKLLLEQHLSQDNKPQISQREVSLAQPIIEDLLQSIWSRRTSKRREVLQGFKDKYPQLPLHVETILTAIPVSAKGNQIYKTLSNIKQDIKSNVVSDGNKSRNYRTQ